MKRPVLLTGFEPFGGEDTNPSQAVVLALDGQSIDGHAVVGLVLPCVFGRALDVLQSALDSRDWEAVLCLGLAGSRRAFSVERVAINVDDARIADNAGQQPLDLPVVPGGAAAFFATLPIKRMVAAMHGQGFPAEVSQTAGTFVCNHVFYGLMHWADARAVPPRCGFMHLPPTGEQPLERQIAAVRLALGAAAMPGGDAALTGGAVD